MDLSSMRRQVLAIPVLVAFSAAVVAIAPPIVSPPNAPPSPVKPAGPAPVRHPATVLDDHVLVAWYGNPWTGKMGILGRLTGDALADGLRQQAAAYAKATHKKVLPAYELIAVVAQAAAGTDGLYRRREHRDVIDRMLAAARAAGFKLVLDIQTGRSSVLRELQYLAPYLEQPDVYLALDPEFSMGDDGIPGRRIGTMPAREVNDAIAALECLMDRHNLPPKVLIVHQFTTGMLPDKESIWSSDKLDVVLDMDGFGSPELKQNTYRAVLRQRPLEYTGFKLFYIQDTGLLQPAQVLGLSPSPSVIIYQ
jgi:hypothetical protein